MIFMRIRLSLTVRNDADLLSIKSVEDFEFKIWIKEALRSYAMSRQTVKTALPAVPVVPELKNIMLSITLDERKDAATIAWLKKLAPKRRTGAVKLVLRSSFASPCLIAYYSDPADAISEGPESGKDAAETTGKSFLPHSHSMVSGTPSQSSSVKESKNATVDWDNFDIFNLKMDLA